MKYAAECLERAEASLKIASSCPEQARQKWLLIAHNWLSLAKLRHEHISFEAAVRDAANSAWPVSH